MKSRISSFEFEETDEEDEDEGPEEKKFEQHQQLSQPHAQETFVQINITETTPESDTTTSPLTSPPPSPQLSPENGLFEQGRNCIEIASKNFCCISVSPIAG